MWNDAVYTVKVMYKTNDSKAHWEALNLSFRDTADVFLSIL